MTCYPQMNGFSPQIVDCCMDDRSHPLLSSGLDAQILSIAGGDSPMLLEGWWQSEWPTEVGSDEGGWRIE